MMRNSRNGMVLLVLLVSVLFVLPVVSGLVVVPESGRNLMYENGSYIILPEGTYDTVTRIDNIWYVDGTEFTGTLIFIDGYGGDLTDTQWWLSILIVALIIINFILMMLPFALVRFVFGILSLFLCMLCLPYNLPLSPYLQTAGLLISALAMLFSVRARE